MSSPSKPLELGDVSGWQAGGEAVVLVEGGGEGGGETGDAPEFWVGGDA